MGLRNTRILPASGFAGAVGLIRADACARAVMAPEDLSIGIVTGLVGGALFVWMLSRRR